MKKRIYKLSLKSSGIDIDVVRKKIKNIHLSVNPPSGKVRISAPLEMKDDAVRLFSISKLNWIKKQQRKFNAQERETKRDYADRESHYFLGKRYLLRLLDSEKTSRVFLKNKTYIELHIKPGTILKKRKLLFKEWYREELKKITLPLIHKWEKIIGVKVNDWSIRQMKTKWGSCNIQAGRIWLNLELVKKPVTCIEFIIVHELIHMIERHHNENFIFYINKFLPKWKQYREELNRFPAGHSEWRY